MTLLLQIIYIQNQHINFMFKCVIFINITANTTIQGYYLRNEFHFLMFMEL